MQCCTSLAYRAASQGRIRFHHLYNIRAVSLNNYDNHYLKLPVLYSVTSTQTKSSSSTNAASNNISPTITSLYPQVDADKLIKFSNKYFSTCHSMTVSQNSKQISELITGWGRLWHKRKVGHQDEYFTKGIQIIDRLAHTLLDSKLACSSQPALKSGKKDRLHLDKVIKMALNGWCKIASTIPSLSSINGSKAQAIINKVESINESDLHLKCVNQDSEMYRMLMIAWVKSREQNGPDRALEVLRRMKNSNSKGDRVLKPTLDMYNICIHGFAKQGNTKMAEQLLLELKIRCKNGNKNLCPDVFTYNGCIDAYAKSRNSSHDGAAKMAQKFLQQMLEEYERSGDERVKPNSVTFGSVISLHANSKVFDGAQTSERILQLMISLNENDKFTKNEIMDTENNREMLKPNSIHFNTVMAAYNKHRVKGAAKKVQSLLVQMEKLYEAGNDKLKPDMKCFITCLDAWAKSKERGAAEKVEQILSRMEDLFMNAVDDKNKLNNYGYNVAIDAWSRSGEKGAAARAESILNRMNYVSLTHKNNLVAPDKITYTSVIKAWVNERAEGFEVRAATLLSEMEQRYLDGHEAVKPDVMAYATVIDAFAKAHKPKSAEVVLERMREPFFNEEKGLSPNITCYNILINAYAKSNVKGSENKAEEILLRTEEEYKNGNVFVQPNEITYTTCIHAIARSDDKNKVSKAEIILDKMNHQQNINCTVDTWNALLNVYAKSPLSNKAKEAFNVIHRMEIAGVRPNIVSYNIILSACCLSENLSGESRGDVLEISAKILKYVQQHNNLAADSFTYSCFLRICKKISNIHERKIAVTKCFESCCKDGQLNYKVIATLREVCTDALFWQLLGVDPCYDLVKLKTLPPDWSRNIVKPKKF